MTDEELAAHLQDLYTCANTAGANYALWWPVADLANCRDGVLTQPPGLIPKASYFRLDEMTP
jgi:hypothetical protein